MGFPRGLATTSTPRAWLRTVPSCVFGTEDGRVFQSLDAGRGWQLLATGLPPVRCVALG